MRVSTVLAGALVIASSVLPAAALTKQVDPSAGYPLPPGVCDSLPGQISAGRVRCIPPNVDPRVADSPNLSWTW